MPLIRCYVMDDLTTRIRCPICKKSTVLSVDRYLKIQSIIQFKAKCLCGNNFKAILERRKNYRKSTNLLGNYECFYSTSKKNNGTMTISDLSKTGMKLRILDAKDIHTGDILKVHFHLDNPNRPLLSKKVIVKRKDSLYLGTEFAPTENVCKPLGFYLMN